MNVRLLLAAGTTRTARIDGISAAGAEPDLMIHTPSADAEIVTYGRPVRAPVVPVSPSGCPTPAVVTRAVRERLGFEATVLDAGLARPTGAPTVDVGASPGGDVRDPEPVPSAGAIWKEARAFGGALPDENLFLAETIPGGTTTALGVLRALGEDAAVSSSLPENPMALKRSVVEEGLGASDMSAGDAAGDPIRAVRRMGDPVLATVAGVLAGAVGAGPDGPTGGDADRPTGGDANRPTGGDADGSTGADPDRPTGADANGAAGPDVTLAGGTQLLAAAALVRHAGIEAPLELATTSFVAEDVAIERTARSLEVDPIVTDPGFDGADHVAMDRYVAGEAKEGVGMGGALALADRADALPAVREDVVDVYDRLLARREEAPQP